MLKATSMMAGAKLTTIFISLIRTKAIALLLGPGGMGVVNLIGASVEMTRVLFACGLDSATVRKVAIAADGDDLALLDQAYRIAARTALFIGTVSCAVLALASPFLSAKFLGSPEQFWWYVIAGCSLIFTPLLGVELAFLQGLKRSRDLATCQIIASIAGTVLTISLVAAMGKVGAIVALLPVAVASLLIHHHFLKRYRPKIEIPLPYNQLLESRKLLKLGSGFAVNGIWLVASGWLNLLFIQSYYGPAAGTLQVGLYGAASTIASFYIGILISSMGTEFYPSLIQAAKDRPTMNRLLNQQTLLSIGIGVPISLVLLIFSPHVLNLLYTREFAAGTELMRWMVAGMAIRFAACPLGFTLLAVSSPRLIALSELAMGFVTITTSYIMLQLFGLKGIGMAQLIANSLYLAVIFVMMRMTGITWTLATILFVVETLGVLAVCLASPLMLPSLQSALVSGAIGFCYITHLAVIIRKESGIEFSHIFRKFRNLTHPNHD
jgi:PST family polysaccharide transporter